MTRVILIVLMWVLLGVLFFTIKKNCCGNKPQAQLPAATSVSGQTSNDQTDIVKPDEDVSSSDSAVVGERSEMDKDTQSLTQNASQTNYDYNEYSTIKSDDDKSIIPFSEESTLSTEVQALLEETCSDLSTSLDKVRITAYGENRSGYLRKMEDFLIRCGVSPGRVDLSSKSKNDTYEDEIVLQVL